MRNDFQEAFDAIEDINEELYEAMYQLHGEFDENVMHEIELELLTNGDTSIIEFAGFQIWSSEDDEREYIDENEDIREPLKPFLRAKMNSKITFWAEVLTKLKAYRKEWRTLND